MYRATGCETCRGTGYKGRLGLHELLVADDTTRKLIQERARVARLVYCLHHWRHAHAEDGRHGKGADGADGLEAGAGGVRQMTVANCCLFTGGRATFHLNFQCVDARVDFVARVLRFSQILSPSRHRR
jgi:hypothetical protein